MSLWLPGGLLNLLSQLLYLFLFLHCVQATLPNQMHAQLTELNGLKGVVGQRCIVMGLISSQVWWKQAHNLQLCGWLAMHEVFGWTFPPQQRVGLPTWGEPAA